MQDRLAGVIATPDGTPVAGPQVRWIGRRHGRRQDRRWATSWSPEQIANRLPVDFPDDDSMRISHEAIYQALYVQGRGALRRELTACLRTGRALRVPRARTRGRGKHFVRPEIMISERPAEADDRAVPGHWEGDLILGLSGSAIGTLGRAHHAVHDPAAPSPNARARPAQGPQRSRAGRARRRGRPRRDRVLNHDPAPPPPAVADVGPGRRDRSARTAAHRHRAGRSTSATRTAPGSAERTRTPTACCASSSRKAPTSANTPRPTSTPSLPRSTAALARRSAGRHPRSPSTSTSCRSKRATSHGPQEASSGRLARIDQTSRGGHRQCRRPLRPL